MRDVEWKKDSLNLDILEERGANAGRRRRDITWPSNVTFLKKGSRWMLAWGDVTLPDMLLEERGSPWDSGASSASRSRGSTSKATVDMST